MQNSNFNNKDFQRMIKHIRKALPYLATALLIGVYVVSAIAGGVFLSELMHAIPGGITLAYSIGAAIQATRATLVFFPQLNPTRPSFSHTGEVIAVAMGVVSVAEIISLVLENNLAPPVAASLSILMIAGVGVELFLLREIKFATEIELFGDESHWNNLQDFYTARKKFKVKLDALKDMEFAEVDSATIAATSPIMSNATPQPQPETQTGETQHRKIGFEMPQRNERNEMTAKRANPVANGVSGKSAKEIAKKLQSAKASLRTYKSKLKRNEGNPETVRAGIERYEKKIENLEAQLQQF